VHRPPDAGHPNLRQRKMSVIRRRGDGMMTSVIQPVEATALGNGTCGLRVDGGRIVTEDCRCVAPASA
jgi:hypothetical protein